MNKVILSGNLTKDLEVKVIPSKKRGANDTIIGTFTLANNEGYGDKKKTTFVTCKIFNKRVESLEKYLIKGTQLNICGKLDIQNYEDEKGNYKSFTSIIVDDIDLIKVPEEEKKSNYRK